MHLLAPFAQTTQPETTIVGLPGWALGVLAIIGALAPFFWSWLAYKRSGEAKVIAHEAKQDAALAVGGAEAIQQSMTRVSTRQNELTTLVNKNALQQTPPPPSPLLLLPLLLIPFVVGCAASNPQMSMASRLLLAKQTHTAAKDTASSLIEAGIIKDQPTKDAIWYASEEVRKGLEAAETKIAAGDKVGFQFVMERVASALDRLAAINARNKPSDTPQTRGDAWTPSRSWHLSSEPLPSWPNSTQLTSEPTPARSRPRTTAARWTQRRPLPALA